jgi:hypothetical protein
MYNIDFGRNITKEKDSLDPTSLENAILILNDYDCH